MAFVPSIFELLTALNSKGLRRRYGFDSWLRPELLTALNSKGLRLHASAFATVARELLTALNSKGLRLAQTPALSARRITHCPEFKGIKTHHQVITLLAGCELLTALNSKGLRLAQNVNPGR